MKDGTEYQILYAIRKKGGVKNELVTDSIEKVKEYLSKAHRQKEEEIILHDREHSDG
jgi:hypothetical protein